LLQPHLPAQVPACAALVRVPEAGDSSTGWLIEIQDGWHETLPPPKAGMLRLWLRAFGQIDAQKTNCVWVNEGDRDNFGIPRATIHFEHGCNERQRIVRMKTVLREIARTLGGELLESAVRLIPPGSVNHEAGTLRMAGDRALSVVDSTGRFQHLSNLFACDASLFPSNGVTNPCLTITALARRVVRYL